MSEAEIAKFWWSRAFVRYKSRARAKGKGKDSSGIDLSGGLGAVDARNDP